MRVISVVIKLLVVACVLVACAWMAGRIGPWKALAVWTLISGAACALIALAVRGQEPGKVTILNFIMGYVLQWGYRVGRGKLPAIVAVSWFIWVMLGAAVVIAMNAGDPTVARTETDAPRSTTVVTLLALSWIVDGALLMGLAGVLFRSGRVKELLRSLGPIMALLLAMIIGSIALVTLNPSPSAARTALMLAGGPPLVVALGYGLFVLVIVTVGRKARWN